MRGGNHVLPITELVRGATGVSEFDSATEARRKLAALLEEAPEAELVVDRLGGLLGLASATPGVQETFWSVRKLLETLAARRPLLIIFDDIQWAEPTFLDLLEYLTDWMRGVPVMLLFLARPEVMEVRGGWLAGKENASVLSLPPLSEAETDGLISNLLGGGISPETYVGGSRRLLKGTRCLSARRCGCSSMTDCSSGETEAGSSPATCRT